MSSAPGPAAADGPAGAGAALDPAPAHDVRAVLRITAFRRLWLSLGLSSFGDWLGLLATTAMAASLGRESSYAAANLAVSGVLILRLAPAIVLGPLAGVLADRFDRKVTMVVGDVLRAVLFVSIPVVGTLWWLFVATVLVEIVGLFWLPAKDATVPNLVPRERLEAANQLSLATTYGSAPLAALVFTGLALVSGALDNVLAVLGGTNDLALYANAATYAVAAAVIWRLELPPGPAARSAGRPDPVWRTVLDGWRFIGRTPLVRGLVVGMLGAFGAGGFVIGVAPTFVRDLGAGEPGYGVLFAAVFTGLASGMWAGPRVLAELTRWRLFALGVIAAGVLLALLALIPNIVLATGFAALLGAAAGVAWVTGYTLLGLEVADELRGRTFAFVQSAARVVLVAVMAFAPALAALIGTHRAEFSDTLSITYNGAALTLLVAAGLAIGIGLLSYRTMDDGTAALPLVDDVVRAFRRRHVAQAWQPGSRTRAAGFFVALEGGDGAGKSNQAAALERWLRDDLGHDVVRTREPGATPLGEGIRALLLHGDHVSPRAEALLFAADRAHHVETVVRPALERGAVVVTDRYVDSSVAYQGSGRHLDADEVAHLSRWATEDLVPDLTVLLDIDPAAARSRRGGAPDRMEREAQEFHAAVRAGFLALARRQPRRYLVVDASQPPAAVAEQVRAGLQPVLPPSPRALDAAEAARAEQARAAEAARAEQVRADEVAAEAARVERVRAERAEQNRVGEERARAEQAAEAARIEAARAAAARAERTRLLEQQRVEQARVEQARAEQQRAERQRADERAQPTAGSWFDDAPPERPALADELFGPGSGSGRGGVPGARR